MRSGRSARSSSRSTLRHCFAVAERALGRAEEPGERLRAARCLAFSLRRAARPRCGASRSLQPPRRGSTTRKSADGEQHEQADEQRRARRCRRSAVGSGAAAASRPADSAVDACSGTGRVVAAVPRRARSPERELLAGARRGQVLEPPGALELAARSLRRSRRAAARRGAAVAAARRRGASCLSGAGRELLALDRRRRRRCTPASRAAATASSSVARAPRLVAVGDDDDRRGRCRPRRRASGRAMTTPS